MPSLFAEENRIFREYDKFYEHFRDRAIIRDGAIGGRMSEFAHTSPRVLFVLKEGNDPGNTWRGDLRNQGEGTCHGRRWTWPNVTKWAALAHSKNFSLTYEAANLRTRGECRAEVLRKIAVVNLKKFGGGATAIHKSLGKEVDETSKLLIQQLQLYAPDLTFAGGDFVIESLAALLNVGVPLPRFPLQSNMQYFVHPLLGVVVGCWHPQPRGVKHSHIYDSLKETLIHIEKTGLLRGRSHLTSA